MKPIIASQPISADNECPSKLQLWLSSILVDQKFDALRAEFQAWISQQTFTPIPGPSLALILRGYILEKLNGSSDLDTHLLQALERTVAWIKETDLDRAVYKIPSCHWPNPVRKSLACDIFDIVPLARQHKFISRTTVIASAGSCFAAEIAYRLQRSSFNYLITERNHFVLNHEAQNPDDDLCSASAAWGAIYNAPAMRQLVERAFGINQRPATPALRVAEWREDILLRTLQRSGMVRVPGAL